VQLRAGAAAAWLPASLGSGYQKFALSLAARLAVWRLSASPRPDAFIIDEGFGACDEEYLEAMAAALEALASAPGGPRLVFLVSHVDSLKARVERPLEITVRAGGSHVANSARLPPEAPRRALEKQAKPRPPPPRTAAAHEFVPIGAEAGAQEQQTAADRVRPEGPPAQLEADPEREGSVFCAACRQSLRSAWAERHLVSAKHALAQKKAAATAALKR